MRESAFREVADEFIHLANVLNEAWATPFLNAVHMYAVAWYNTHFFFESDDASENQDTDVDYCCDLRDSL